MYYLSLYHNYYICLKSVTFTNYYYQTNNDLVELGNLIQTNKNNISALDTRVTNAINGGSLDPEYTFDIKNSNYSDSIVRNNGNNVPSQWCSYNINQIALGGAYPATLTRTYNTIISIKANYKLKVNFSVGTDYGQSSGYTIIMVLDSSGTILYQEQVNINNLINKTIPLSNFNGKNVRIALKTTKPENSKQDSFRLITTINSIIISNK